MTEYRWTVIWKATPSSSPYFIDFNDGDDAARWGGRLAEQGRIEISIEKLEIAMTPADIAALENIQTRVYARLASDRMAENSRLRQAHKAECETCQVLFLSEPTKEMVR